MCLNLTACLRFENLKKDLKIVLFSFLLIFFFNIESYSQNTWQAQVTTAGSTNRKFYLQRNDGTALSPQWKNVDSITTTSATQTTAARDYSSYIISANDFRIRPTNDPATNLTTGVFYDFTPNVSATFQTGAVTKTFTATDAGGNGNNRFVEGFVKKNGYGVAGVTMLFMIPYISESDTRTTEDDGFYRFSHNNVGAGWTSFGLAFLPTGITDIASPNSRTRAQDQSGTGQDFDLFTPVDIAVVTGKVVGGFRAPANLSGIQVTISGGGKNYLTTTDASGNYSYNVLKNVNYRISGSKAGFTVDTSTRATIYVTTDTSFGYMTATPIDIVISGNLTTILPNPGVTMVLSGTYAHGGAALSVDSATVTSSTVNGSYSFTIPKGAFGLWVVTPKSTAGGGKGYSFNPTYKSVSSPTTTPITGQDFDVSKKIIKISGTVKDYFPNPDLNLQGISVQLWDDSPTRVLVQQSYTNSSGEYEMWANARSGYRIKPISTNTGYLFVDTTSLINLANYNTVLDYIDFTPATLVSDTPNQNFSGRLQHYDVIGKVLNSSDSGLSGYVINLKGVNPYGDSLKINSDSSNASGQYTITGIPGRGNYKTSPSSTPSGGMFVPIDREYTNLCQSYTPALTPTLPQNFKLYSSDAILINGKVVLAGTATGLANALITIKEGASVWNTTFSDGSGNYSFPAKSGSTYSVTAQKDGYSITSTGGNPQSTGVVTDPITLPNFEATFIMAVPLPISPLNNAIVSLRPMLLWNLSSGAQSYDVEAYEGSFAGTKVILAGSTDIPYTQTYFNMPSGALSSGVHYVWRVRANTASGSSDWSNTAYTSTDASFTTSPSIPLLKNPVNATTGYPTNVTFEWYPVGGATEYILQYSKDPNFVTKIERTHLTSTSQYETGLEMNAIYFWRVKVQSPVESGWSDSWYFDVGGSFTWDPASLDFKDVVVNRTKFLNVTLYNNASSPVTIPGVEFTNVNFSSIATSQTPIVVPAYSSRVITVNFSPITAGTKTGVLNIYHNVSSLLSNPIAIPLVGNAVSSLAGIEYPLELDFGTVALYSGIMEKTIVIRNLSDDPADMVTLNSNFFETMNTVFQVRTGFPIFISPNSSVVIVVRFDPQKLGTFENNLHIINTSRNAPDAKILVKGKVVDGNLIVIPPSLDFGQTTAQIPSKVDTVYAINKSVLPITIFKKAITGDTVSFQFVQSIGRITLQPDQVDTILIKFEPFSDGRKNGMLDITCSDAISSKRYVPLTGIAGDNAVIAISPAEIDFGDMIIGQVKDTTVVIRNIGNINLLVKSMSIDGNDKDMFSFLGRVENKVLSPWSDSIIVTITATAKTINRKQAYLNVYSSDRNNPAFPISIKANVLSPVFWKNVDKIVWDTVAAMNCVDTVFKIGNIGNSNLHISKYFIDGPSASDFRVVNLSYPFDLKPGDIKEVMVNYCPKSTGVKYARLAFQCNDPVNPEPSVIFRSTTILLSPELVVDTLIDFGKVSVDDFSRREFVMQNISKYADLVVDSIKITFVQYQPFSYIVDEFPFTVERSGNIAIQLQFHPTTEIIKKYSVYMYIYYSNSSRSPARIRMIGEVIRPKAGLSLQSVLKFGKVPLDTTVTQTFLINNSGDGELIVNNIQRLGPDSLNFNVLTTFPIIVFPDTSQMVMVTFTPKTIGTKDAQLKIIWNDRTNDGIVDIWAEGIKKGSGVLSINNGEIPKKYNLSQNYPNPFNPSTCIKFSIMKSCNTTLKVFNVLGKEVTTLIDRYLEIGEYTINFDGSKFPSGVYYYRLQSGNYKEMKKMLFIK
jgi:hypothetical protein